MTVTNSSSGDAMVVLLEMSAGDGAQCEVLQHLTRDTTPVVVITGDTSPATAGRASSLGAVSCISLETDGRALVTVIETAAAGGTTLHPAQPRSGSGRPGPLTGSSSARGRSHVPAGLTPREWEVLASIASGVSNADIAAMMHLSIDTIKTHVRTAYRKIGVRSRTQAVLWYIDLGPSDDRVQTHAT